MTKKEDVKEEAKAEEVKETKSATKKVVAGEASEELQKEGWTIKEITTEDGITYHELQK